MEDIYIKSKIEGLEKHVKFLTESIDSYRKLLDKKDKLIDELLELLKQNNWNKKRGFNLIVSPL